MVLVPVCLLFLTLYAHMSHRCKHKGRVGRGREGGREEGGEAERKLCLPFLMVKYTDPLLRVALKSVANAVRKVVGLRTPMLDKRGVL